jgi:hypothetical protein
VSQGYSGVGRGESNVDVIDGGGVMKVDRLVQSRDMVYGGEVTTAAAHH